MLIYVSKERKFYSRIFAKHWCQSVAKFIRLYLVTKLCGITNKNSSGDEIANVNFCTTTTYM